MCLLPPSSSGAVSFAGSWRIAHQTMPSNPATGIFSRTISQMNVHASTWRDRIPQGHGRQAGATASGAQSQRGALKARDAFELFHTCRHLVTGEARDSLGAECLDVEGGQG